jgi:sugar phosphate isomerase/epimerase
LENRDRIPYALTAYGLPYRMGYLATKAGVKYADPLTPIGLMDIADAEGLAGVEFPLLSLVPSFDGAVVRVSEAQMEAGAELKRRGLKLIADYGALLDNDAAHCRDYLGLAAKAGANVVRATLSHILCGDRRNFAGGWDAHLAALAERLRELLPFAEELGVCIAVENHQDATNEDLLELAERTGHSPAFGITLDTGNPLAVGQDPTEAARKLAPIIRHVHLKDYTIHFAPEGYRLARCAAGEGAIDFPAILAAVRSNGHAVLPGIEIAAQATRTIPVLDEGWWEEFPARNARELVPVLRLLWQKGRPADEPYSSAWERGEQSVVVAAEELDVVRRSVDYFRGIG